MKAEDRMTNGEWKSVALGDIFDIARGGSPRPIDKFITDDPNGVNWIMISDATSKYITSTKKRIIKEGMKKSREVHPGDFLLTNSMSFGRPYIMQTSGCIHDGWLVLSPKTEVAHPDYFYHLLGSDILYSEFERRAAGATVKNLNIDLVKGVEVLLPPFAEQRRIAEVLDRAEALRTKRRAALAQLDSLTQSLFLDLFGDPITNPKGWPTDKLSAFCDLMNGFAFKSSDYVAESRTLNCRMSNIRPNGEFDVDYHPKYLPDDFAEEYKRYVLKDGDVIIAMTDMATEAKILGVPTVVTTKGKTLLLNQRVGKLVIEDSNSLEFSYLKQLLAQPYVKKYYQRFAGGGVQINLGKDDLLSVSVTVPPIALQREFARQVTAVEALKTAQRASLTELDTLFACLQHRAFNGELFDQKDRESQVA